MKMNDHDGLVQSLNEYIQALTDDLIEIIDSAEYCGVNSTHIGPFTEIIEELLCTKLIDDGGEIRHSMDAFVARPGNDEFYAVYTVVLARLTAAEKLYSH